jgi:hypothetical protein
MEVPSRIGTESSLLASEILQFFDQNMRDTSATYVVVSAGIDTKLIVLTSERGIM